MSQPCHVCDGVGSFLITDNLVKKCPTCNGRGVEPEKKPVTIAHFASGLQLEDEEE